MKLNLIALLIFTIVFTACGSDKAKEEVNKEPVKEEEVKMEEKMEAEKVDPMDDKGIGPVTSVTLGEIDEALAEKGKEVFKTKCTACHKISKRFVGPALKGVTERRTPEWIMNMILNPEVMVAENEIAKQLLKEYNAPMANQSLTEEEARSVLEYFRTNK